MIFFDIDQTLLDFKGAERAAVEALYEELFSKSRFSKHDFYRSWQEIGEEHFKKYLQCECTFEQQRINRVKDLYETTGEYVSDQRAIQVFDRYVEYFEDSWRAFDDVLSCLDSLKGFRLGIISNGDEIQQKKKLEKLGIYDYFEVVVTSGRVGKAKPDPFIFEFACREACVRPEESFYVGDNLKVDILGCGTYNMKGIWINRDNLSDEGTGVITISSLKELKDQLFK
ncbi:HAD family hydrolase [Paenibacillus alkalitolerans]|uniref:HAD family hydrolase n=1 Tax=Paenibacillus alkalitolerans TaxID=2799335 RepID=UPI0018F738D8|nr:HAD family hydrolase [Paenibacillus alkalitolerans]